MNDSTHTQAGGEPGAPDFFEARELAGWVHFRVRRITGDSIPARISKDALEEKFGHVEGAGELLDCYLCNAVMINSTALALAPYGNVYTVDFPMTLGRGDFA
jgi:hypothetical protein